MGKWIDRSVLLALTAAALYLLLLQAFDSIVIACALSFICCGLLIHARSARGDKYRMTRMQAQTILERWAYGPDADALAQLCILLKDTDGQPVYLMKHPSQQLGLSDVFGAWKSHRDRSRLVIAAPCYADGRARTFARTLQNPTVEILDAAKLIPLIRRSDLPAPRAPHGRRFRSRLKEALTALPGRRPWPKNLRLGLLMLLVYLITGSAAYLLLAVGALFLAGAGIRMHT